MTFDEVQSLLVQSGFAIGLFGGAAGLAVGSMLSLAWPCSSRRPTAPLAGLLLVIAAAWALADQADVPTSLVPGLALLALAGIAAELADGSRLVPGAVHAVMALPGAWLITGATDLDGTWPPLLLGAVIAGSSGLVGASDNAYRQMALGPVLMLVSLAGVYAAVPDTERAVIVLGAAVPLAVLGWPLRLAALGRAGASATVGLLAWVAVTDGSARPGSVVGAIACLGVLLVAPVARTLLGDEPPDPSADEAAVVDKEPAGWRAAMPAILAHLALVAVAARVAGLRTDALESATIAGFALVATAYAAAQWPRWLALTGTGSTAGTAAGRGEPPALS